MRLIIIETDQHGDEIATRRTWLEDMAADEMDAAYDDEDEPADLVDLMVQ